MTSKRLRHLFWLSSLVLFTPWVHAGDSPRVVELFTSQGCYSCPAADRLLGQLSDSHDTLITLELHVDYWDDLVYGAAGQWKDPFSNSAYSARQRAYNRSALQGRRGVYTPQAIIDGRIAAVGADRRALLSALGDDHQYIVNVAIHHDPGGPTRIVLSDAEDGKQRDAKVWMVRFDRRHVTKVPNGENQGKTLVNHNVVRKMSQIGEWHGRGRTIELGEFTLLPEQGCAVLVQDVDLGPIHGAARC